MLSLDNVDLDAGTLSVVMENDESIGGFQFALSGVSVSGASGGSAQSSGFTLSTSPALVLGFSLTGSSISPGSGVLTNVAFTGDPEEICLSGVVISSTSGSALDYTLGECYSPPQIVTGCTDSTACNYNSEAEEDDGSCAYTVNCYPQGCLSPGVPEPMQSYSVIGSATCPQFTQQTPADC